MSNAPVLILTGSPGAGKTTVAGLLADRSPAAVHLEVDVFFHFIRSGRIEPWEPESHEQNRVVMKIVGEAAAAYARAGYFTIIDGIVLPRWFLLPCGWDRAPSPAATAAAIERLIEEKTHLV